MKKIFLIVSIIAFNFNIFSQDKIAKINFKTTEIDYGVIEKGSNGLRDFEFTNNGNAPLIITNVKSTCGCTIPKNQPSQFYQGNPKKYK